MPVSLAIQILAVKGMSTTFNQDTIVHTGSEAEAHFVIVRPLAHLGGNKKDILCEQYHQAAVAVEAAVKALVGLYHGRDFYIWGDEKAQRAHEEHVARVKAMNRVYMELFAMAEAIANQP